VPALRMRMQLRAQGNCARVDHRPNAEALAHPRVIGERSYEEDMQGVPRRRPDAPQPLGIGDGIVDAEANLRHSSRKGVSGRNLERAARRVQVRGGAHFGATPCELTMTYDCHPRAWNSLMCFCLSGEYQ